MRTELTDARDQPDPRRKNRRFSKVEIIQGKHHEIEHQEQKTQEGHQIRREPTWKELNRQLAVTHPDRSFSFTSTQKFQNGCMMYNEMGEVSTAVY